MKLVVEKSVTVITPTVGSPKLKDAIESVKNQTYKCKHLVVIDGPEHNQKIWSMGEDTINTVTTPENTGKTGGNFYGHRIYAAYPHLINSDYVLFLDEDNWFEPDHVESLVDTLEYNHLDFAYSFRKIYDKDRNYICDDNCESLGKWPVWPALHNDKAPFPYLIDTSSFLFRREFLIQNCHLWASGWGGDRRYLQGVHKFARYDHTGKHTLCYRLDGNPGSVSAEFFLQGNENYLRYYDNKLPWSK